MQWFKNLNTMPRLLSSFGVLILLAMGMSYLAVTKLADANGQMAAIYQKDMMGIVHVENMNVDRYDIGRVTRDAILNVDNPKEFAEDERTLRSRLDNFRSELDEADKTFYTAEGIAALKSVREATPGWEKAQLEVVDRLNVKDMAGARMAMNQAAEIGKSISAALSRATDIKLEAARKKFEASNAAYSSTRTLMLAATLISAVVGIFLAVSIARGFSLPLGQAVATLEKVAGGDLTVKLDVDSKDEVGRMAFALNDALEKLRSTLEEVTQGAMHAGSASQQLAAATQSIAGGAQEQAASLEETSASLEEITAAVRQSADNARQASQFASGSRDAAEQGQHVVSNAITAMGEINAASAKISEIISTIDEIAFQTNLLAVNAAVEAARAGEEGRGFAVVAAEVRSLAQRSAEAAKEIKGLIQDSLRKVARGTELVNKSGETLQGIVSSVKRVTDIVGEIAAAAGEQSTGIEQVSTAMTQMDQVTQSNSAQTEELSSTAESLSDQSQRLMDLVATFTLSKGGKDIRSAAVARRSSPGIGADLRKSRTASFAPKAGLVKRDSHAMAVRLQPVPAMAHAPSNQEDASFEEF